MSHFKTVCRTLFYQYLVLIIGFSIGFVCNAEWAGYHSAILSQSLKNTFFQIEFNESTLRQIKSIGALRFYILYDMPSNFMIIEDAVYGKEFYWAKFSYNDVNGLKHTVIDSTRIRWQPWEYNYKAKTYTSEELKDYIENGDLNSHESDNALRLMKEKRQGHL